MRYEREQFSPDHLPMSHPVLFIADDKADDHYLYRQAVGEAYPRASVYFFANKGDFLYALQGSVFPIPSLIVLDWDMAARKGYKVLERLAHTPDWQTIPVVIVSDPENPVDEEQCGRMGYELVLPREIRHEKLVERFKGLLRAFL